MTWPLSDDIEACLQRFAPPMQNAKHRWALPLQILVIAAVLAAGAAWANQRPHIPVHQPSGVHAGVSK